MSEEFITEEDVLVNERLIIQDDQILDVYEYESGKRLILVSAFDPTNPDDQNVAEFEHVNGSGEEDD